MKGASVSDQLRFEDEEINITLRRAWDRALRTLSARVNKPTFETHIRAIRPLTLADGNENGKSVYLITLGVPNAFTREWVEKRHASLIGGVLEEVFDRDVRLSFVLSPREKISANTHGNIAKGGLFDSADAASSAPAKPPLSPSPTGHTPSEKSSAPKFGSEIESENSLLPALIPAPPQRAERPATKPAPASKSPAEGRMAPATASDTADAPKARGGSVSRSGGGDAFRSADAPVLNPRYTFENFVVGSSNRLAHAGARAVAEAPGAVYNPLFVYGSPGLGKTHLMHAIGNEISQRHGVDSQRVAYLSGETFASYFITSLREHRSEEFRRKWRSVDLFLVDDIQFIAGKEHTKEEFFHTFNALYQLGKQIVISSDRSPRDLRMMDERLRSRFECGLIADIAPPDLETRLAILQRKSEIERMRIPDEVLLYMAKLVQSNIRTLEGALVKIIAYASLQNSAVTTQLAASVLEHYYISAGIGDTPGAGAGGTNGAYGSDSTSGNTNGWGKPSDAHVLPASYSAASGGGMSSGLRNAVTPEVIQRVICKRFGIDSDALIGKRRDREVVVARQIAMHLMRELTEASLPGIGQMFGGRDHSTVSHACDKVRNQIPQDSDLRSLIEDLATQIRAQAAG